MEEATDIGVGSVFEAVGTGAGSDQGSYGGVAVTWRRRIIVCFWFCSE